ncbi:MAG TPA: tripartite tricarboxylate transporter substrate binding protein [Burkholderiales bacterium]|nr:tripartite tricarboxylate transporter substrate binding protein [Burkholderiales bacterium]
MKSTSRHVGALALAIAAAAAFTPFTAKAQKDYPLRPVRVVVPYTPGGITDVVTRTVMQELGKSLGQTIIVDNRPGANSIVGVDIVAKASPDGYTMGSVIAAHAANQTLYPKLPYDSVKSFETVSLMASAPLIVCAANTLPANNVKDLIALARAKPGQITFASSGIGAAAHLTTELLMLTAGVKMTHVPYKGTAPALQDLMGGQVMLMLDVPSSMLVQVRAGRIKALGMASEKRVAVAPDLPTLVEQGVNVVGGTWVGLLAPAHTPQPVVERVSREIATILQRPEMKERFVQLGIDPVGSTPQGFRAFLLDEIAKWGKVIKQADVHVEQ